MSKLISAEYQKLNSDLHEADERYGSFAAGHASLVAEVVAKTGAKSVLDYGCGKGTLKPALLALCPKIVVREYDPAIPGKGETPSPADVVACLDVLEHIEPETLDNVLAHLRKLTKKYILATVALFPAEKILSDGRNAHLILEGEEWWLGKLRAQFDIFRVAKFKRPGETLVIAGRSL